MKTKIFIICLIFFFHNKMSVSQPTNMNSSFGLSAVFVRHWWDSSSLDTVKTLTENLGTHWTREDFPWEWIELDSAFNNWDMVAKYDSLIDTALAHGINIYGILCEDESQPNWSSGDLAPSTPKHYQDFANYCAFVVGHFGDRIKYWEIWNEPDGATYWPPTPNPYNYTQLLTYAYNAIKTVDSTLQVIGCAYGGADLNYLIDIFKYGGLGYMDILSFHPYSYDSPVTGSTYEISFEYEQIGIIRDSMLYYGEIKPIWASEVGVPTHVGPYGSSEDRQANLLVRIYLLLIAKDIKQISWYDLIDDGTDSTYNEDNFGIVRFDKTPKPAYYAYRNLIQLLSDASFIQEIYIGDDNKGLIFNKNNKDLLALWTYDELYSGDTYTGFIPKDISIYLGTPPYSVFDIWGNTISYLFSNDTLYLTLTNNPTFILGNFGYVTGQLAEKQLNNISLNIYPNPTKDKLNIEFTDNANNIEKLSLFNTLGKIVYTKEGKELNVKIIEIDLSEYKTGIYYLDLKTEEGILRKKISIVK